MFLEYTLTPWISLSVKQKIIFYSSNQCWFKGTKISVALGKDWKNIVDQIFFVLNLISIALGKVSHGLTVILTMSL